jgi:hypothetical protein
MSLYQMYLLSIGGHPSACSDLSSSLMRGAIDPYKLLYILKGRQPAVHQSLLVQDQPVTNAGYGSNLTLAGSAECDASIMSGDGTAGAVGCVPGEMLKQQQQQLWGVCLATYSSSSSMPHVFVTGSPLACNRTLRCTHHRLSVASTAGHPTARVTSRWGGPLRLQLLYNVVLCCRHRQPHSSCAPTG